MDITWEKIKRMGLRARLAWAYTIVFSVLFALAFSSVYIIFAQYRKREFYQRLKDKTLTTYKLFVEVDEIDGKTLELLDKNTINNLYEQKIMLFDSAFNLLYSSIGEEQISYPSRMLLSLKNETGEIEISDSTFELIGIRFQYKGRIYYGIAKAYDRFGRSKMEVLRLSLVLVYAIAVALLVALSLYLSKIITRPLLRLTSEIGQYSPGRLDMRIQETDSKDEVALLTAKFNELLGKVEKVFKFQYHFIHHVSHELKTPLAVMVSNTEAALAGKDAEGHRTSLEFIKSGLMEMSHIINVMLDISRAEHQVTDAMLNPVRIDELLFECIDELAYLNSASEFNVEMDEAIADSDALTVRGNARMLKMAMTNLLKNAVNYSISGTATITLVPKDGCICISLFNDGEIIAGHERDKLFSHLFRGQNSRSKKGFGIGLVLVQRIVTLHNGSVTYDLSNGYNCFTVTLPLAAG